MAISIAQSKEQIVQQIGQLKLSPKNIYLFCRGTKSKSWFISRHFNLRDTNSTHVGLGYLDNNCLRVFNVTDSRGYENALVIDSPGSFIAADDVYYFSIWKYKNSVRQLRKMKQILKDYAARNIVFDIAFRIKDDDTLYCAEFCAGVLNKTLPRKLRFDLTRKQLDNSLFEAILRRKELIYYPVDFFQPGRHFSLLGEFWLKN